MTSHWVTYLLVIQTWNFRIHRDVCIDLELRAKRRVEWNRAVEPFEPLDFCHELGKPVFKHAA